MGSLLSMRQAVYSRLGEPYGSAVAQLSDPASDTPVVLSNDSIDGYLNEAQYLFARLAVPSVQTGTRAGTAGEQTFLLRDFDTGENGTLWAGLSLTVGGVQRPRTARSAAMMNSTRSLLSWWPDGSDSVSLSAPLLADADIVLTGLATPPALVAPSGETEGSSPVPTWCPSDLHDAFVFFACWQVCAKAAALGESTGAQNETLGALAPQWQGRWMERVAQQQARLQAYDPPLWATYFSQGRTG